MPRIFLALVLYFIALALAALSSSANPSGAHLAYGCQITDRNGELLRNFPGMACLYLPDGRVISAGDLHLSMLSADGRTLWRKDVFCHHQPKISADGKSILVLTSSLHPFKGEKLRFDRLSQYDFTGNLLRDFDFYTHRRELLRLAPEWAREFRGRAHPSVAPVKREFSHANAISEVAPGTEVEGHPAFKNGGYLLTVNGLSLVLLVDREFRKILWSMPYSEAPDPGGGWHDARLLPGGKLLFYNNARTAKSSAIEQIELATGRRTTLYQAVPPEAFWGESQGGAQPLENGELLLTEFNSLRPPRIFTVTKDGKITWSVLASHGGKTVSAVLGLQEARFEDLTLFLKNNKGL